jgi:hypothetical protein
MLHHDAELDEPTEQDVEARLSWDLEAQAYLSELQTLRQGVRDIYQSNLVQPDLADSIMSRVEREQQLPGDTVPASSLRWQLAFCSAAALAVAAMLWLHGSSTPPDEALIPAKRAVADAPPGVSSTRRGVAIESVDFGVRGGSIFMVQAGEGTTPVVWLSEPEEEVRSEPL